MRKTLLNLSFLLVLTFVLTFNVSAQVKPNTFLINGELLLQNKLKITAKNQGHLAALKVLVSSSAPVLNRVPYTVVSKTITPPSGDNHDYMSLAPYWWPNPKTVTGLPYIQKDGQTNPQVNQVKDNTYLRALCQDVRLLGLAYYYTNEEKYAQKATELLQVFFLNSATRMNPNLKYAQTIRGDLKVYGTCTVDTEHFPELIDGVQLLAGSKSWTSANHEALQSWFNQYLNWMLTSEWGKKASIAPNNIGTYYDLQVVTYALFVGNKTLAKSILDNQTIKRMETQLGANNEQVLEVARTNAWTYCNKNLDGWFCLASAAENVGLNLWDYTSTSGKSLKKAFQWMLPYGSKTKAWPYQQIGTFKPEYLTPIARIASSIYKDINLDSQLATTHTRFMAGAYLELLTSRYY
ncbi:alginate lyase family protein [Adhaeribacter swui]|uniref:Alginate lyase family protein n=1 Tax=Adhaeribacter swui TaxID=2086471 RepID=A0A7G7G2Y8_9BACT|nr:alginate lyase family protein [Adhaeribacter swui]QNF31522.1 alginate lyase family protein [Adhaeribacter swui]